MTRDRVGIAAFAILAAILVATAQPAAAAHTTGLASINTTDTDFQAATTLTNVSVIGSGTDASVTFNRTVDDFDDGSLSEYTAVEGSMSADTNAPVIQGNRSLKFTEAGNGQYISTSGLDNYPEPGDTFSVYMQADTSGAIPAVQWGVQDGNNGYELFIWPGSDQIRLQIQTGGSYTILDSTSSAVMIHDSWYDVEVDWDTDGTMNVTVYSVDATGTRTGTVGTVSAVNTTYTTGGIGYQTRSSGQDYAWDYIRIFPETGDTGTYVSSNHSVSDAVTGFTDLSLRNASAEVTWLADTNGDGSFETTANQSTFTTTGNHSLDLSGTTASSWRVNVTYEATGSTPTGELHDEGVMAGTHAPSARDATASPNTTSETVDSVPVTLSVDINDTDFPTQGDSVTAEFFVNGSSVGTDTATSNGTVSVETTPTAGEKEWHVNLTDDDGHTVQSSTYRFVMPGELELRNESDPSQLVTGANATITFYFQTDTPLIETREDTDNDGRINMTGLPVDEDFVVVANATDYIDRRIYVNSLLDTQRVFLLPSSAQHVDTIFELQDFSGLYPPDETAMEIQRALNLSGTTDWRTVEGDYFGATSEFAAQLAYNQRHRLVLHNTETGDSKVAGTYTPLVDATKTIKVFQNGSVTITDTARVSVRPDLRALPSKQNVAIDVTTVSDSGEFSHYNTTINLTYANGTEVTLATLSGTQAGGETLSASVDLTNGSGGRVDVNTSLTLQDGTTTVDNTTYFVHEYFANQYNLLSVLGDVESALPSRTVDLFTNFIALILSVLATAIAASRMPLGTEGLGLVFLGFVAAFVITGWADANMLFAGSVGWIAVAGTRRVI